MRHRRTPYGRWADAAIFAAFFALSIFAYDRLFVGIGGLLAAPLGAEFADVYLPGHNPWTGTLAEPAPTGSRFASLTRQRHADH
ncbi:MAG TPA: hypothetical protein VN668_04460 [Stellaceae bacterium]|nr:hypothetical protein [Stellaceae bacterium]